MKSKKYMYMHTIKGYPAHYVEDKQISYIGGLVPIKLVPTLKQIKREQKATNKWRKKYGYSNVEADAGWLKVEI